MRGHGGGLGCRAFPVSFPICVGLGVSKGVWGRSCFGAPSSAREQPLLAILPWLNSHITECVWSVAVVTVVRVRWRVAALGGQGPEVGGRREKGPAGAAHCLSPLPPGSVKYPFCPFLQHTQPTAVVSRTFSDLLLGTYPYMYFLSLVLCFIKGALDVVVFCDFFPFSFF